MPLSGLKVEHTPGASSSWGRGLMFLTYLYSKDLTVIKEGDDLTIFGLLTYNSKSDEFCFDNPLGFIQQGSRAELLKQISSKIVTKVPEICS